MQDHPTDAKFLNCPIRFYQEMEVIFAHSQATGKYVVGSGEPLRVNMAESQDAKVEGSAGFPLVLITSTQLTWVRAARPQTSSPSLLWETRGRGATSLRMRCSC
jgi:hypothetical protein